MTRIRSWMVTGASGFLGQATVQALVGRGDRVTGLDTTSAPAGFEELKGYHHVVGDVRDASDVAQALDGVKGVIHGAAALPILRNAKKIYDVNVNGTRTILEQARSAGVKSTVFVSTTAVYGLHKFHPITEEIPLLPVGPYGGSKIAAEKLCEAARAGMNVPVVRPKTFLGRGRLGVFEILFDWIHDGKRIPLIGSGHNRYQLLHVDDLIEAMVLAAEQKAGNDTFNIAAREFGTLREDLRPLFAEAGHEPRFLPTPRRTAQAALWALDHLRLSPLTRWHYGTMASDSYVEVDKVRDVLGWSPRYSNKQTLLDSYRWYHEHRDEVKSSTDGTTHTVPWDQKALRVLKRFA